MKRRIMYVMITILAVFTAGTLAAQTSPGPSRDRGFRPNEVPGPNRMSRSRRSQGEKAEITAISGILGLSNGRIALQEEDTTYYVLGLDRLIGFIDGLKEGARVALEGYAFTPWEDTDAVLFQVAKLTLNGKEYDGLTPVPDEPEQPSRPQPPEFGNRRMLQPNMRNHHRFR